MFNFGDAAHKNIGLCSHMNIWGGRNETSKWKENGISHQWLSRENWRFIQIFILILWTTDSPHPNMQMGLSIALDLKQTVQNSYYGNSHILHIWLEAELLSEKNRLWHCSVLVNSR